MCTVINMLEWCVFQSYLYIYLPSIKLEQLFGPNSCPNPAGVSYPPTPDIPLPLPFKTLDPWLGSRVLKCKGIGQDEDIPVLPLLITRHYQLAEILILAGPRFEHDIQIYWQVGVKYSHLHSSVNTEIFFFGCDMTSHLIKHSFLLLSPDDDLFSWLFRWFQHLTKICITCITFWWFWALHDVSLPNWMKYYSTREPILQKISCSFLFALPFHTITAFFQSGSQLSWLNAGCSCISF